jgi:hypothetical protein
MRRSQQQWRELIAAQECSNLSIVEYCRKHKISTKSFYGRRSEFKKQASTSPRPAFIKAVPPSSSTSSEFAVLSVGSAKLHLPKQTDTKWLAALMRQLA